MTDPLDSNIVSLTLAWIIAIPIFATAIAFVLKPLDFFTKQEAGAPRWLPWLAAYYLLCLVVISPLRYMILQLLLVDSYVVQSFGSLANALITAMYFSFVMAGLYVVGIGLPNALLLAVLKKETKATLIAGVVAIPLAFAIGYALFFLVLPLAAWTIRWLPSRDVIRSTNGPATVFYKLAVEPDIPRIGPKLEIQAGETANERLRSHVSQTYLSPFKRTKQHFTDSFRYIKQANDVSSKQGEGFIVTIPDDDLKIIIAAHKASLRESQQVDCDLLNTYLRDLGTMYRNKYIPGLRDVIKGMEDTDSVAAVRGQLLLRQWGIWYNERRDAIWDAL